MTEHTFSQTIFPARNREYVQTSPVLDDTKVSHKPSSTGISHKIIKKIKNSSVEYFCIQCNTHYFRLKWVKQDHPGIDTSKFKIEDFRKEVIHS